MPVVPDEAVKAAAKSAVLDANVHRDIVPPPAFDGQEREHCLVGPADVQRRARTDLDGLSDRVAALHLVDVEAHLSAQESERRRCAGSVPEGVQVGHGEAVAIGLALDATYSYLAGLLPPGAWQRVMDLLANLGLPLYAPQLDDREAVFQGLEEFRVQLGGRLTITLLREIGQGLETNAMDSHTVAAAIDRLRSIALEGSEPLALSSGQLAAI